MRKWPWVIVLVLVIAAGRCALAAVDDPLRPKRDDHYELYQLLVDTIDQVERNYVHPIDRRKLFEAAIRGVLEELDAHSGYIGPEEISSFETAVNQQFGGIGIRIEMDRGQLKVVSPLVGTPAYRAGILAGDRILEIDGRPTKGLKLDEVVRRLQGAAGSDVTLKLSHPARAQAETVKLTREIIHIDTVLGDARRGDDHWNFLLDNEHHIGYIRLTAFSRRTADELRAALAQLKQQGMTALVLDLRFNPGGLLSSAIEVSDLFVAEGKIVSTEGRNVRKQVWKATKKGTWEGFPLVVLVNHFSASASEIVAACLQDHGRAVVMGERTYGKGSVQRVIEMEQGRSALKLTTASYHRPNGKNIHRFADSKEDDDWGVRPNKGFELKLTDAEIVALVRDRRRRDILRPGKSPGGETAQVVAPPDEAESKAETASAQAPPSSPPETQEQSAPKSPAPNDSAAVDLQLKMALEYLRDELAAKPKP